MDDADDDLTQLAIRKAFESEDQYFETVESDDEARISQRRKLGRVVARQLKWKIRTMTVPLDDGST